MFSSAKLSPNGQHLALVQTGAMSGVFVTDLATRKLMPALALADKNGPIKGLSVDWLEWKDNDRLIVGLTLLDIQHRGNRPDGPIVGLRYGRFILAVNRDGTNPVQLLKGGFWNSRRGGLVGLLDRLRDDPNHILAMAPTNTGPFGAWKVDIRTGEATLVEVGDARTLLWKTDSAGTIVARLRELSNGVVIEGRSPGQTQWTTIVKLRAKDLKALDDFAILGPTDKPARLYVAARPKDKSEGDTRSLRIYDFAAKTLSAPIWPAEKYDIESVVYDGDTYQLRGVCFTADVYTCDFEDPNLNANFRAIEKFFHNKRSVIPISVADDGRWWLFSVSGPDEPAGYYLFDWKTKVMALLGERYDHLPTETLATMSQWSYAARDGVSVPAYLTRPRAAPPGPLPLIVMPHGGPAARDSYAFDIWDQFLATRGYLVFQPNFRGSGGYGVSYEEAGDGQWGGRMADDITDGVRKLIETGQADPKRICIFGASYGGYAALYAGATHPELYKCVVSWAGVADLAAMLNYEKLTYGKDSEAYAYWRKAIGDPATQADAVKKASPLTYAASYGPPVLLIHGRDDEIVSPEQSRNMEAALKKAGKDVKLSIYADEEHPSWETSDEKAALAEIITFIEAHIAPATPAATPVKTAAAP
ncbi:MAG: alpha/beta fold hydrolase [Caulobacteraceae bacterium]|nr:alpha/beta fold hydrolase [Caulobacteraceae bacterium]